MAGAVPTAAASTSGWRAGQGQLARRDLRREDTPPRELPRQATAPEEAVPIGEGVGEGGQDKGKEVLPGPPQLECAAVQCDGPPQLECAAVQCHDVPDVYLFEYGDTPRGVEKEIETRAGKGAGRRR